MSKNELYYINTTKKKNNSKFTLTSYSICTIINTPIYLEGFENIEVIEYPLYFL